MATALKLVRQVGEDQADYHTEARKRPVLKFAQIRSGLLTPEHEERMGEAIWLYLWLHIHVDLRTGTIPNYTHAAVAADSTKGIRTVRARFEKLRDQGYITSVRHQYVMDVTITNFGSEGKSASTLNDGQKGSSTSSEGKFNVVRREADFPYIDPGEVQSKERANDAVPAAPPKATHPKKPKAPSEPKTNKLGAIIDAIRAAGEMVTGSSRNGKAMKDNPDVDPVLVAEAYVAAAQGRWGSEWLREAPKIWAVIEDLPGYLKWKERGCPPPTVRNKAGRAPATSGWDQDGADLIAEYRRGGDRG